MKPQRNCSHSNYCPPTQANFYPFGTASLWSINYYCPYSTAIEIHVIDKSIFSNHFRRIRFGIGKKIQHGNLNHLELQTYNWLQISLVQMNSVYERGAPGEGGIGGLSWFHSNNKINRAWSSARHHTPMNSGKKWKFSLHSPPSSLAPKCLTKSILLQSIRFCGFNLDIFFNQLSNIGPHHKWFLLINFQ